MTTTIDDATLLASLRATVPPASASLSAPVSGRVEVLRDRAGVPHVYARSTADVYFGLGFAMAQDRLWQMDRLRRRALGRQAEILGEAYVASDLMHHAVGIPAIAAREVERTDAPTRTLLESFVAGINRQIEACGRELPIEFSLLNYEPEPFTVRDTLAILRGEWWSLNGRLQNLTIGEAARLLPDHLQAAYLEPEASEIRILPPGSPYPVGDPSIQPSGDAAVGTGDGTGSNNWAVAGSHTASGHALLCGDPHQPFWLPSSWYEYAVHGPEDDAAGAGHPGAPGLWWGMNGRIAWAITNNAASQRDLYREEVHPTDPSLYRDGATWRRFDERTVEVRVRDAASVRHTQRATVRGPIVNHVVPALAADGGDPPLALRWVGQDHLDDARAVIAIGRASDWDTFRAALRDWSVAAFNFVYADRSGRVGYQCAGRVPIRGRVARGYRDAHEPADQWRGTIPFEALPHVVDPPRGYVASANERAAPDDYPYPLYGSWGGGQRAERIRQTLEGSDQPDRTQSVALQNDVKSCRAERLCPPLVNWLARAAHPGIVALRAALAAWDYGYTPDTAAPTLFETFMEVWQDRVARERFPAELVPLVRGQGGSAARLIERGDLAWFSGDLRLELEAAAGGAMDLVRTRHGADPAGWAWGKVHLAHWRHPLSTPAREWLDIGPTPVDGGGDTVRNTGVGQPAFSASSGAEYRMVVDFAEPDRFLAVQNIGNSGQPGSPHYADQFPAWLAGEYHTVALHRPDVERDLEGTTIIEPR
ncbi:MAG TPA: penicillin acylase family protein [Chloroflexota bacterium]|nr:penicillin acylase family protein [Chloroflexota bacterium]